MTDRTGGWYLRRTEEGCRPLRRSAVPCRHRQPRMAGPFTRDGRIALHGGVDALPGAVAFRLPGRTPPEHGRTFCGQRLGRPPQSDRAARVGPDFRAGRKPLSLEPLPFGASFAEWDPKLLPLELADLDAPECSYTVGHVPSNVTGVPAAPRPAARPPGAASPLPQNKAKAQQGVNGYGCACPPDFPHTNRRNPASQPRMLLPAGALHAGKTFGWPRKDAIGASISCSSSSRQPK